MCGLSKMYFYERKESTNGSSLEGTMFNLQCAMFLGIWKIFYRKFIKSYTQVVLSLIEQTQKNQSFGWTSNAGEAFDNLKQAFTFAPILVHVDLENRFIIRVDASNFARGCVLSQIAHDEKLHLVAFHSRKFKPAKINYEIHDNKSILKTSLHQNYCLRSQ